MKLRFRAEWLVLSEELDFGKLFTETNEQKFSLGAVRRLKICSLLGRRKYDLEHSEGDLCCSRSEWEGGNGRVECHLHRGDGLGNKRKWGYWEEWCTWRRVVDQEQSLGGHHRRMCTRKTGNFHIWHGSNEMTDMTWTSWEQSRGYQTTYRRNVLFFISHDHLTPVSHKESKCCLWHDGSVTILETCWKVLSTSTFISEKTMLCFLLKLAPIVLDSSLPFAPWAAAAAVHCLHHIHSNWRHHRVCRLCTQCCAIDLDVPWKTTP